MRSRLPHRLARLEQAVEFPALVEHRRLRAVEVLGCAVVQDAAAKADRAAAAVMDRELDALAKTVIGTLAVFALDGQAKFQQGLVHSAVRVQRGSQVFPAGRRKSNIEPCSHLAAETAVFQVVDGATGLRVAAQLFLVVCGDLFQQIVV